MAVDARNILNHQANDADHRTFASSFHNMLIAAGLTQTTDTGQANLATITRPGANTVSGFEMFRFNDTEQATLPIFIKVEYGSGGSNTIPGAKITVAQATNGAGTLTTGAMAGLTGTANCWVWANSADTVGLSRPAYCAYGNGHLVIAFGYELTTPRGATLIVERPKNYDGTRSTDGVLYWGKATNGSGSFFNFGEIERAGGGGPAAMHQSASFMTWLQEFDLQDDIVGANISLIPIPFIVNGNLRWSAALAFRTTAIGIDTVQAVSVFGTSRNYKTLSGLFSGTARDTSVAVPYY